MRQGGLLVGAFAITLTLLSGGFFLLQGLNGTPVASPAPSPVEVVDATPAPTRVAAQRPTAQPAPTASPSPAPTPTPAPNRTAGATVKPARTTAPSAAASTSADPTAAATPDAKGHLTVRVPGSAYTDTSVPANGRVVPGKTGSVTFSTDRTVSGDLQVRWDLPAAAFPPGYALRRVDVAVCGTGTGDFWETYGPAGSDPTEEEVTQPDPDGCWHYTGGSGADTTVVAGIRLGTTMTVRYLDYTLTLEKL